MAIFPQKDYKNLGIFKKIIFIPPNTEKGQEVSITKSRSVSRELLRETQVVGKYNVTSGYQEPFRFI